MRVSIQNAYPSTILTYPHLPSPTPPHLLRPHLPLQHAAAPKLHPTTPSLLRTHPPHLPFPSHPTFIYRTAINTTTTTTTTTTISQSSSSTIHHHPPSSPITHQSSPTSITTTPTTTTSSSLLPYYSLYYYSLSLLVSLALPCHYCYSSLVPLVAQVGYLLHIFIPSPAHLLHHTPLSHISHLSFHPIISPHPTSSFPLQLPSPPITSHHITSPRFSFSFSFGTDRTFSCFTPPYCTPLHSITLHNPPSHPITFPSCMCPPSTHPPIPNPPAKP